MQYLSIFNPFALKMIQQNQTIKNWFSTALHTIGTLL